MVNKLNGKVAVVTGASKGIGAGIAKKFAEEGAQVLVNYSSSKEAAEKVVKEIVETGGKALAIQADVSKPEDIKRMFHEATSAFGKIDILVNNAGFYEFAALQEVTLDHYHKIMDLNVLGLLLVTQEALKHFNEEGGSILNISSVASVIAGPNTSVYSASKAAVDAITKSLSKELGKASIRVNAINPGMVVTEGLRESGIYESDFREKIERELPLQRLGKPEDIAATALFLASDDASWITGELHFVSGGRP